MIVTSVSGLHVPFSRLFFSSLLIRQPNITELIAILRKMN